MGCVSSIPMVKPIGQSETIPDTVPPAFSLKCTNVWGKCINVVDGDTVDIAVYLEDVLGYKSGQKHLTCLRIRLFGIDAPEMKDKVTHQAAEQVKKVVADWILRQYV